MTILKVKIVANIQENNDLIVKRTVSYLTNISSFLTTFNPFAKTNMIVDVIISDLKSISNLKTNQDFLDYFSKNAKDAIYIIGIFNTTFGANNPLTNILPIINDTQYLFTNYEPIDRLFSNDFNLPFIILNEFVSWMFYLNDNVLEKHSSHCVRDIQSKITSIAPIDSSLYEITDTFSYCPICSDKILKGLAKLPLTMDNMPQTPVQNNMINKDELNVNIGEQSNLVSVARKPPPRRTIEQIDPNFELPITQRKQINDILKSLNLHKEPLEDSEYLETRQRFFDGKISEQVFIQLLKRKAI